MNNNFLSGTRTRTFTDTGLSAGPTIWLTGAKGMLGKQIASVLEHQGMPFIGTDMDVDITDRDAVHMFVDSHHPSWIVNCAAYTAVDRAETDREKAMMINGQAVANLAEAANRVGATVIHFSTDYVFDGNAETPYGESDRVNPISVYGETKLAGEQALMNVSDQYFIIRISWLYGVFGSNFVETMLRLMNKMDEISVVADQLGSPTYAGVLAENVITLMKSSDQQFGLYHYQDEGRISWYGFAREIKRLGLQHGFLKRDCRIAPVTSDQFVREATRPAFSVFNTESVREKLHFSVKSWKENLEQYFEEKKEMHT